MSEESVPIDPVESTLMQRDMLLVQCGYVTTSGRSEKLYGTHVRTIQSKTE